MYIFLIIWGIQFLCPSTFSPLPKRLSYIRGKCCLCESLLSTLTAPMLEAMMSSVDAWRLESDLMRAWDTRGDGIICQDRSLLFRQWMATSCKRGAVASYWDIFWVLCGVRCSSIEWRSLGIYLDWSSGFFFVSYYSQPRASVWELPLAVVESFLLTKNIKVL